ncbi:unnamed protein product [Leptosia nina]|uniref:Uncharacterized protein n=1 Tax=Leptosia nina TaxID=320188 RepID=A0AAV1JF16_9NEOP
MGFSCRTCLITDVCNDINELPTGIQGDSVTGAEIMLFCLDIMITSEPNLSTKLCKDCFIKIIDIYKFKRQALHNDSHMRNLDDDAYPNGTSPETKHKIQIKLEDGIEDEIASNGFESDDEFLSVLKSVKYEFVPEEAKENVSSNVKEECVNKKKTKAVRQVCEACGKTYKNLREHMKVHLPPGKQKTYKCKYCDKVFAQCTGRYRHTKIKHLGYREHCKLCDKDVVCLKSHNAIKHDESKMKFVCEVCGRRFLSPSKVKEHKVTAHTKERLYPCGICDKTFGTKTTALHHRRQVHDKEKKHLCQICSKRFFKKYHLDVHIRSHTKEKPYECTECGKWYSSCTTLKSHQLTHTALKKIRCKHCNMSFTLQKYLNRHYLSVHAKEKKYQCNYCEVSFSRSDHRNRHQRTAHERNLTS